MVVARLSGWGSKSKSLKHWDKDFEYLFHLYSTRTDVLLVHVWYLVLVLNPCLVLVLMLKEQCDEIFGTYFSRKRQPGPYRNSHRRFSKFFRFRKDIRENARKNVCHWLRWHGVSKVVEYINAMSAWSLITPTRCRHCQRQHLTPTRCWCGRWLRQHDVGLINDCADTML